jgi:Flp pilus assembly protein TadD
VKRKKFQGQAKAAIKNPLLAKKSDNPENWKYYIVLTVILLISFIAYSPVFQNGISTWDDDAYIRHNPFIYSINLKEIFTQNVMGNYHPFTILIYALEYHFFGLNATGFHAVNLSLHLLNVILVFYVVFLLSDKAVVALVASLLFGIHPIHVESVAWVSELKDLLYTLFFLSSYIFYLKYLNDLKKKHYALALLLFMVSLLSKAMAVSLPVVLVLTDYFKGRKINVKTISEKVPFFLLAIASGIVAVLAQQSKGAVNVNDFSFPQRILFACYGFISYIYKLIFPLNLSAYYPYPIKYGENIPIIYYAYLILFLGLAASVFYSLRFTKKIFFGVGFFTATIFLVLQLFPVGSAIMADRYSYVPSIGVFYLAGEGFHLFMSKKSKMAAILLLTIAATILLSIKTFERSSVWKNDLTLWNDVIDQDQTSPLPYNNRGYYYLSVEKNNEAIKDFNKAIELDPDNAFAYNLRGMAYMRENRNKEAIDDFNKSIELNPDNAGAYDNRAWVFMNEGRNDEAINDFNKAIALDPGYAVAYNSRGVYFINQNRIEDAINDFNKAIALDPGYTEAYYDRGNASMLQKRYEEAISFYTKAIELKNNYAQAYYYRGIAEFYSGRNDAACRDLKKAAGLGFQTDADLMVQICK